MKLTDLIAGKAPAPAPVANVASVTVANSPEGESKPVLRACDICDISLVNMSPEGFATVTDATIATLPEPVSQSEAGLHAALAEAAVGLPVPLAELIEAFGAEGRADWLEGYTIICRPEFLRGFAVAVSERLARERAAANEPGPPARMAEPPTQAPAPLEGLPLLREDWQFIKARTRFRRDRDDLLDEYRRRWIEAAAAEPVEFRRANIGRRAANEWLRELGR